MVLSFNYGHSYCNNWFLSYSTFPIALIPFWFILLAAIGIIPFIILLWYIKGKEQFIIRNKTIEIGKSFFKFKKSTKYDLESVLNLDILPQTGISITQQFFGGII